MTSARAYVRKATGRGAIVAGANTAFVTASLDHMDRVRQLPEELQWCTHLEAGRLLDQVALWPTFGDQAHRLWCLDCWSDPGPAAGCQACDRRPVLGLRRVLSPAGLSAEQIIMVGQLCSFDRRRLT